MQTSRQLFIWVKIMNEQGYISKWKQIQETVLINLLKGIPTNFRGSKLRTSL
jgi:ribosomal protein S8